MFDNVEAEVIAGYDNTTVTIKADKIFNEVTNREYIFYNTEFKPVTTTEDVYNNIITVNGSKKMVLSSVSIADYSIADTYRLIAANENVNELYVSDLSIINNKSYRTMLYFNVDDFTMEGNTTLKGNVTRTYHLLQSDKAVTFNGDLTVEKNDTKWAEVAVTSGDMEVKGTLNFNENAADTYANLHVSDGSLILGEGKHSIRENTTNKDDQLKELNEIWDSLENEKSLEISVHPGNSERKAIYIDGFAKDYPLFPKKVIGKPDIAEVILLIKSHLTQLRKGGSYPVFFL